MKAKASDASWPAFPCMPRNFQMEEAGPDRSIRPRGAARSAAGGASRNRHTAGWAGVLLKDTMVLFHGFGAASRDWIAGSGLLIEGGRTALLVRLSLLRAGERFPAQERYFIQPHARESAHPTGNVHEDPHGYDSELRYAPDDM